MTIKRFVRKVLGSAKALIRQYRRSAVKGNVFETDDYWVMPPVVLSDDDGGSLVNDHLGITFEVRIAKTESNDFIDVDEITVVEWIGGIDRLLPGDGGSGVTVDRMLSLIRYYHNPRTNNYQAIDMNGDGYIFSVNIF